MTDLQKAKKKFLDKIKSDGFTRENVLPYIIALESANRKMYEFAQDNLTVICINCNNNVIKNCLCEMKQYNMRIIEKYKPEE